MKSRKRRFVMILLAGLAGGFFVGTLLPRIFYQFDGEYAGLLSRYAFQNLRQKEISYSDVWIRVFRFRIETILFVWMSSYTSIGIGVHFLYLLWVGESAGLFLSVLLLKNGYEGILLFFCCTMPQWLFYFEAIRRELRFLYEKWSLQRQQDTGYRKNGKIAAGELLPICSYFLAGSIFEATFGLFMLKLLLSRS